MLRRSMVLVVAAGLAWAWACGEEGNRLEGVKATPAAKPEVKPEGQQIKAQLEQAGKTAVTSIQKEEVAKPPLATEFYLLSEAYDASGYRPEALKKKIEEKETTGIPYVKLLKYNDMPEIASIYDSMGNHTQIVAYLWDKDFNVYGAVNKDAADRMLGMFIYCAGSKDMYVHDLSTFRVHAPFTRKIVTTETSLTVEYVDGHDGKGELPLWPECKDVADSQEKGGPYQSPFGVHKEAYTFDADGNLTSYARYAIGGALVEDIQGIAKKELSWKGGRLAEESWFTADEFLAKLTYQYSDKGERTRTGVLDANGIPTTDYIGISSYEFEHDKRSRVAKETRKDVDGNVLEVRTYKYGPLDQVELLQIADAAGNVKKTHKHTYNKKGARTEFGIYEGDPAASKLLLDPNGVALYRWAYTDKGKVLKETRYGPTMVFDKEGKSDYVLVNALDGWSILENEFEKDSTKLVSAKAVKVDANGNQVFEEGTDKDGILVYRLEKTYEGTILTGQTKTLYTEQQPSKRIFMDAEAKTVRVAIMQYNVDGLLMETAYFGEDEKTPAIGSEGYHKQIKAYEDDQKLKSDSFFDANGAKLRSAVYEYDETGKIKTVRHYDATGKEVAAPAA